jgi:hypothetical protein
VRVDLAPATPAPFSQAPGEAPVGPAPAVPAAAPTDAGAPPPFPARTPTGTPDGGEASPPTAAFPAAVPPAGPNDASAADSNRQRDSAPSSMDAGSLADPQSPRAADGGVAP